MVQALVVVVFALLLVMALYLWFQNRALPELNSKIGQAIILGLTGFLLTTWYSLRSERIDLRFFSTVHFHKSDLLTLDEHDTRHHLFGGDEFSGPLLRFIRDRIEHDEKFGKGDPEKRREAAEDLYFGMVFLKIIDRLFWAYADWWDVRIRSVRSGNAMESTVLANKPDPKSASLAWEDFLRSSDDKDLFFALLSSFSNKCPLKKMTVPPKTNVSLTASRYERSLHLENPFVRISITLFRGNGATGATGIGDYAWFLGYDKRQSAEFWSESLVVNCKAEFQRTRYGHPEMATHKKWVETMFAEIRHLLDDEERMNRAREYRDLIGRSK